MNILFTQNAWEEYCYWQDNDKKIISKIRDLLSQIQRTPFQGIGNPEGLRNNLKGYWSRRITREHRIVYKVDGIKPNQVLTVVQLRYHY